MDRGIRALEQEVGKLGILNKEPAARLAKEYARSGRCSKAASLMGALLSEDASQEWKQNYLDWQGIQQLDTKEFLIRGIPLDNRILDLRITFPLTEEFLYHEDLELENGFLPSLEVQLEIFRRLYNLRNDDHQTKTDCFEMYHPHIGNPSVLIATFLVYNGKTAAFEYTNTRGKTRQITNCSFLESPTTNYRGTMRLAKGYHRNKLGQINDFSDEPGVQTLFGKFQETIPALQNMSSRPGNTLPGIHLRLPVIHRGPKRRPMYISYAPVNRALEITTEQRTGLATKVVIEQEFTL